MRWGTNENRVERATMGYQWDGGPMRTGHKGNVGAPMRWGTNEFKQCGGDLWIGGPVGEKGPMRWGANEMGDQWNGRCVGANWGTNGIGDQWDGGPLGLAEIGWMNEKGVVGDLWIGGPMRRGPMSWGTNEMGDQWVGGTNEMGDQWNGWCMSANWGTNEMGDWWVGGPMRWGTNEMGDQWDGGPLGLADDGVTNEKGDQWDGGPVIWGTNEMGDQWAPIMYWGTNELGDQWEGDQWDGGPMRWGTSERIPHRVMVVITYPCHDLSSTMLANWGRSNHHWCSDNGCRLVGAKPLSEPMLECCELDPREQISLKFNSKFENFHSRKCT